MKTGNNGNQEAPIEGNTKPQSTRITPCKRWAFTLNNYTKEQEEKLYKNLVLLDTNYIYGFEVGENGTPHLQGYVEFKKKTRPIEAIKIKEIHWEKCKGNRKQNIDYCSKDNNYKTNMYIEKAVKVIATFRPWQQQVLDYIDQEPDDRHIIWIWEEIGNVGKSSLSKYLAVKKNALVCEGKSADIFNGVYNYFETNGRFPNIIIIDMPRCNAGYMNYGALEKLKNGLLFNSKYESKMMIFNPPHVIVFCNVEPEEGKYSDDRLIIKKIDSAGLGFEA